MDKRNIEAIYPLSPTQRGLLLYLVVSGSDGRPSNAFFEQFHTTFRGDLDPEHLRAAWEHVIDRHPSLRTLFLWERRDSPVQVVLRSIDVPFTIEDWRDRSAEQQEADFAELLEAEQNQGFRLDRGPLVRFFVIRTGETTHRFLWCFSHLLLDGWSIALVFGEAMTAHAAIARGETPELPPAAPYRDYIAWLQEQDENEAEAFWLQTLDGSDGATSLPTDRDPGAPMTRHGARLDSTHRTTRVLGHETWDAIHALCRSERLTPNAFFQGVWGLLLSLYTREQDVVWGSVVSGRTPEVDGVEAIAGLFINALPVRARIAPDQSFLDWLRDLQMLLADQRQFEYVPIESIQRWLDMPRERSLFESLFVYENYPAGTGETSLEIDSTALEETTNYPLTTYAMISGGEPVIRVAWQAQRFADADIERLADLYAALVQRLVGEPAVQLGAIELMADAERDQILALATDGTAEWPSDALVHRLVAAQAERAPDAVALSQVGSDDTVRYAELVSRSRRLGHRLRAAGVGPDHVVAVSMERSPDMVVALLGVLEAGGAYLPIDPDYPADRVAFMLEDSGAGVLVTSADLVERFDVGDLEVVTLDEAGLADQPDTPVEVAVEPHHLAYVIYTSGSTGKPKGVLVEHRNLTHYATDAARVYGLEAGGRALQFATISFDTSAEEIYPALLHGATLVLRDDAMISAPDRFLEGLAAEQIDLLNLPTAFWHELCAELAETGGTLPDTLRGVIIGGEAAIAERLEQWHDAVERGGRSVTLWNTYGPTETTIVCTRADLSTWRPSEHDGEVPIGRPLSNVRALVVDASLRPRPIGLPGELIVGGPGVTRGYHQRDELTADRFVADPFGGEGRVYRTGDLVTMAEDGTLLFRGRVDAQVKIRGFRIEPGEIESALLRDDTVRDASVVAREVAGDLRLIAYVVAADGTEPTDTALRAALAAELPDYMVPAQFVFLGKLPKTPSGKVDRKALPAPETVTHGIDYVAPRSDIETMIAALWSELLGRERIGLDEDFFQLGGHSLLVGRLTSRLRKTLGVELALVAIFEHPTLRELSAEVERLLAGGETENAASVELPPIVKVPRDGSPLPLSYPQERVWVLNQLDPTSVAYNFQMTVWFHGELDIDALQRALTEIVRRHEVFHCTFPAIDGEPAMVLHGPWEVELPETDLRHVPDDELDAAADQILQEAVKTPFDVTELPLVRWRLVHLRDDRRMLIQVEHHFVHDGWSLGLLLKELKAIYPAYVAGKPSPLPDLEVQYGDFSTWQRNVVAGERLGGLVDHWKQTLDGMPTVLDLPTDHPRPNRPSTRGDARMFALPNELYTGLRAFGKEHGFTLYMTMLASFKALMYRYTGALDMGIGAGVANRRQKEQEPIIGMMVNTVVMRGDLSGDPTFAELLKRTRGVSLDAFAHQDMPFERLVEALQPERHVSRNPVFQVMFSFHDAQVPDLDFGDGSRGHFLVRTNRSAKTDLNVIVAPQAEQAVGQEDDGRQRNAVVTWEYNRELFEPETIDRMIDHYLTLAADAIAHPEKHLSELVMVGDDERAAIRGYSRADADYPRETALFERFRATAEAHPDIEAVVYADSRGTDRATYAQLLDRASRLAGHLAAQGVRPGDLVGLATARGVDMTVGMLGILGAGGAYVPLDPSYPAERLALMVEDTGMPLVVAQQAIAEQMPLGELPTVLLDAELDAADAPPVAVDGGFPAYVIYTSGSTGKPKGAVIPQRAVTRLVCGTNFFDFAPGRRIAQVSNASFDAATFEIWGALLHGGTLVGVEPSAVQSPEDLAAALGDAEIDGLFVTTALFHQLVQQTPELFPRLGTVMFGGERCDPGLVRRCLEQPPKRLLHVYGPTESTTFATFEPVTEVAEGAPSVPIGGPLANTELLVLDRDGTPTPVGVVGELCLGGDGLALGYHRRPGLTAERFVPHPSPKTPGERVYRTGDLVRWTADGSIDFVGRLDFQVKVRGFRIELGEIAAVLEQHDAVGGAVVLAREDAAAGVGSQDRRVVAYVTPAEGSSVDTLDLDALRDVTAERLPDYMVPAAFVALDTFPLNANGKVDRRALPAPEYSRVEGRDPETETERQIAAIWLDLLPVDQVSVEDDFFTLGGHSLLATQLASRLRKAFGIQVGLGQIFEFATIARQAEMLDGSTPSDAEESSIRSAEDDDVVDQAESMAEDDLDALLGEMLEDQDA